MANKIPKFPKQNLLKKAVKHVVKCCCFKVGCKDLAQVNGISIGG